MRGVFLTLEGGEGVGKTTQIASLAGRIEGLGRSVLVTLEPGGTDLGRRIRELLVRETADPPNPVAELFLYAADRAHHVEEVIRPALREGTVVLCDRYADATEAYQGWGRRLPLDTVRAVNALATDGLWPDRTLVLDLPPETGVRRSLQRQQGSPDPLEKRFEAEALSFHSRVRDGYEAISVAQPERVRVVDAAGAPEAVAARIWEQVRDLFPA